MVILPVEDVRRHAPFDRVLPHVAQMLLVQRHALDALHVDDGGDEIRCRNVPARQRAHRVERPNAVRNDADAPAPALRNAVEILRELALRLPRRPRLVIEAYHLAAWQQRPVVLRLLRRAVLAVDIDEGGGHRLNFFKSQRLQILVGAIVEFREAGGVLREAADGLLGVAGRNTNDHSHTGTGEKNAVSI